MVSSGIMKFIHLFSWKSRSTWLLSACSIVSITNYGGLNYPWIRPYCLKQWQVVNSNISLCHKECMHQSEVTGGAIIGMNDHSNCWEVTHHLAVGQLGETLHRLPGSDPCSPLLLLHLAPLLVEAPRAVGACFRAHHGTLPQHEGPHLVLWLGLEKENDNVFNSIKMLIQNK